MLDDAACTRCGICIGICDSFASDKITTPDQAKRMVRKAKEADGRLILCCREDIFEGLEPAGNVAVLNCLSSLSPEFVFYLLSCDIEVLQCHDASYCADCATGGRFGGRLWMRAFELAAEWAGREVGHADVVPEEEHLSAKLAAPDRRGLFTGVAEAVEEVASGRYRARKSTALEDFMARRERMRAELAARPREGALFLDDDAREASRRSRFARKLLMAEARENMTKREAVTESEAAGRANGLEGAGGPKAADGANKPDNPAHEPNMEGADA